MQMVGAYFAHWTQQYTFIPYLPPLSGTLLICSTTVSADDTKLGRPKGDEPTTTSGADADDNVRKMRH
jgi:hypothetical protein